MCGRPPVRTHRPPRVGRFLPTLGFPGPERRIGSGLRSPGGYMRRTVSTLALALIAAVAVAAIATSCGSDSTAPTNKTYVANLIAANEGTGHTSPGSGVATFVDLGTEIDWTLTLTNMTAVIASHIHGPAPAGVNTSVIINLFIPN